MSKQFVIGTIEAAEILGRPPRAVLRMVERQELAPILKLPGKTGAYLFDRSDIEALKKSRVP